jgi:hypothetical protein
MGGPMTTRRKNIIRPRETAEKHQQLRRVTGINKKTKKNRREPQKDIRGYKSIHLINIHK